MKKSSMALLVLMLCLAGVLGLAACGARRTASEDDPITIAVRYDIMSMDAAETSDDYLVPMNVFDRLFETRRIDGEAQVVPSLCTSYEISPDAKRYDFVLREGVVFSNGSPLTASDVKYSFERLLAKAQENTEIPLEVVGGQEFMDGTSDSLEGFVVEDDTHFSIRLVEPNVGYVAELSSPAVSIVDAETTREAQHFGHEPSETIGSGPYIITEWVANDHATFVYNDKFWGEEPSVKKVIMRVIPDASTQNLMFKNGELDILDLGELRSSIVESEYKTDYADQIVYGPSASVTYLALNESNEYLSDLRVRKAIAQAIDYDSIISVLYHNDAIRQHGVIPTGVWGSNEDLEGYDYDPDAARALLAEAGYEEGEISLELSINADANNQLTCEAIASDLAKVGIDVQLKTYDFSSWVDRRKASEMELFVAQWILDYNDPANIMQTFFGSPERTAARSLNYPDEEVMRRVVAAASIVDDAERAAAYQELERKIAVEDVGWVPLLQPKRLYCISERVESFTPHWAGYSLNYFSDIQLADEG